ncbi:Sec region non-globular protein [Leptospira perolatii]|uniref:Sec region non-globular protein n=1 Tax=Leptospira perolatii TaxID=2023191 RepID=A0A2M9ZL97_9LEPT|nr:SRP-less Sec system protein [Leptospira perolatii]PJZ70362.1 Sec region non-globular protein [Leptospira perolatii]PJZ72754.1 Sec region non-globular protein [Leptospira perolatii]
MNQIRACLLLFSFVAGLSIFGQDGEELNFLDKVGEPKKTSVSKKSSKSSKKKRVRKGYKKKKSQSSIEKQESSERPDSEQKKKIEPENSGISPEDTNGKNGSSTSNSNNTSQSESSSNGTNKEESKETSKPYWVNEETVLTSRNLPGYTETNSANAEKEISFKEKLGEILKIGQDKKKEEEKRKAEERKDQGGFVGFLSEYRKPLIILVLVVLFALYRFRAGGPKINRRSPVTINKVRRD